MDLLVYAAVMGSGAHRGRTGQGELVHLVLRPLRAGSASIYFVQSPLYPAQFVLDNGREERYFQQARGLTIHVQRQTLSKDLFRGDWWGKIKMHVMHRGD